MQINRKSWVDYVRFIAIFLVLYGHFISVGSYAPTIPSLIAKKNEINLPIIPFQTHIMWKLELFVLNNFHIQTAIVGVVLFLILAGYLSVSTREKYSGKEFIIKRIVRLSPVLAISVIITGIILLVHQGITHNILEYLATIFLVHPVLQYEAIIGAVWVLCVEMLFYVILIHIKNIDMRKVIIVNLLILFIIYCQYKSKSIYLSTLLYFLKFIPTIFIGVTIKICEKYNRIKQTFYITLSIILGWGTIKICSFVIPDESTYTNIETYISALFIIYLFILLSKYKMFAKTPLFIKFIDEISYSIYLLQINVGMAFMYYLKMNWTQNAYIIVCLSTIAVILTSTLVHYFAEIPIQKWMDELLKNKKIKIFNLLKLKLNS